MNMKDLDHPDNIPIPHTHTHTAENLNTESTIQHYLPVKTELFLTIGKCYEALEIIAKYRIQP